MIFIAVFSKLYWKLAGFFGMGNSCNSMADSCQCMTKLTEITEVISLQLIKINEKKKIKKIKTEKKISRILCFGLC